MPAEILDGKAIARDIRDEVARGAAVLAARGVKPGLAVVLVGDDASSAVYVKAKGKACEEAGMHSVTIRMPSDTTQAGLDEQVDALNADPAIHGILVQMPLPKQIAADSVIRRIKPEKDVDGFHPVNVGKMLIGDTDGFVPCTPAGIQVMLHRAGVRTAGKECVVVGRSNIVGKPMVALMLQNSADANCTVTICHSGTTNMESHTRRADILIAAVGKPHLIRKEMVKPGAVVIDVGINRIEDPGSASGYKLAGDVAFDEVREVASLITPVPGGVGPMTIAMLLRNTLRAAERTIS